MTSCDDGFAQLQNLCCIKCFIFLGQLKYLCCFFSNICRMDFERLLLIFSALYALRRLIFSIQGHYIWVEEKIRFHIWNLEFYWKTYRFMFILWNLNPIPDQLWPNIRFNILFLRMNKHLLEKSLGKYQANCKMTTPYS